MRPHESYWNIPPQQKIILNPYPLDTSTFGSPGSRFLSIDIIKSREISIENTVTEHRQAGPKVNPPTSPASSCQTPQEQPPPIMPRVRDLCSGTRVCCVSRHLSTVWGRQSPHALQFSFVLFQYIYRKPVGQKKTSRGMGLSQGKGCCLVQTNSGSD